MHLKHKFFESAPPFAKGIHPKNILFGKMNRIFHGAYNRKQKEWALDVKQ